MVLIVQLVSVVMKSDAPALRPRGFSFESQLAHACLWTLKVLHLHNWDGPRSIVSPIKYMQRFNLVVELT